MPTARKARRARGEIELLPSGSHRVRVYAGLDPLTKKRHYLVETVPAGPGSAAQAEKARTRMLSEVDDRRASRTNATVDELFDRYLDVLKIEETTRVGYERMARRYIRPLLGEVRINRVDGEVLDTLYSRLRRCREHRSREHPKVDHRTQVDHECDARCVKHVCRPLGASYLRQIHVLLNGAFARAVKWNWIGVSPIVQADAPAPPAPDPQPPTPRQAARILEEAFKDPEWGMLVWVAMTTGPRRGEMCALRWDRLDFDTGVLDIRTSIAQVNTRVWEKDTKTHQRRRIVLDAQTLGLLAAYRSEAERTAALIGTNLKDSDFIFSAAPDHSESLRPDTVTQRYTRMCKRLGFNMHIQQLRHFSATELIAAGVDVRTVAGRLGHSGGGTTTLRVYSAWVAEADQRAAQTLNGRLALPASVAAPTEDFPVPNAEPVGPYVRIADDVEGAIRAGYLPSGSALPPLKEIAARYSVAVGTAHRAVALLAERGRVRLGGRGRSTKVV
jgi:integrase